MNEMERNDKKGFFIYENGEMRFIELNSRSVIVKEIFSNNISAEELMQKCLNEIEEVKEGEKPILIIKLKGRLNDKRGEINKIKIVGKAVEKGYLHANISLSELKEKDEALIEMESKNADQLEEEYLKKKNYNEKEIDLARKIMNTLGDDLTQKELEERNFSFIKLLKGWINED
jgi:leucyl aminopeptidase